MTLGNDDSWLFLGRCQFRGELRPEEREERARQRAAVRLQTTESQEKDQELKDFRIFQGRRSRFFG